MVRYLAAAVLTAVMLVSGAATAAGLPERVIQAARDRAAAGEYPAIVIAYVEDGKATVMGFGALPNGKAPDGDTVFEIGSITKTFTATILADAVTRRALMLDTPVATLLPGFTIPSRSGKPITLESIAIQRSGLPRMPDNFQPADPKNPYADYDAAKLKAFLSNYTLARDPGAAYEYSNLGFGLLGTALAADAHVDYRTLLKDRILTPLGMHDTDTVTTPALAARFAPGHDAAGRPQPNWDLDALAGAGAIRSTGNDMLRYLRANMGEPSPLTAAMRLAHAPRIDAMTGERIGLAWMTRTGGAGPIVWHNGMTGGYASSIALTADGRRGIVVLASVQIGVDDLAFAALDPSAPLAPVKTAIAVPPAALLAYEGRYQLAPNLILTLSVHDGKLFGQATGQGPFALFASAPDEFFARVAEVSISFTRDAGGHVNGLVLHQEGDHPAPRLPDLPSIALDPATLAAYAGQYRLSPRQVFEVTVLRDALFVQLTGQEAFQVFPSAKDKFFYKVVDAQIEFERDASGKVIALVLHQGGHDMRSPRITP